MLITCRDIKKSYAGITLFENLNFEIKTGEKWGILGANSSGKSTLLKIIARLVTPEEGIVTYDTDFNLTHLNFFSPEMTLMDDFLVKELVGFHFKFRSPMVNIQDFWMLSELKKFENKRFQDLSSGLANKLKLALVLFTKGEILLLDEPCTNFDVQNIEWYQKTVSKYWSDKLICIASNMKEEYFICDKFVNLQ